MDKNIIWVVLIIIGVIGVSLVISGTAPEGASYHKHTYTDQISGASGDIIEVSDKLIAGGGLIVEVCDSSYSGDCPSVSNAELGQIWLDSHAASQIPTDPLDK